MGILGVISTRLVMERSDLFKNSSLKLMENEFGQASVFTTDKIALILRHGNDPKNHILPHLINYRPGMIVVPDDFITLTATPTIHKNRPVHITPSLNENVRQKIIKAALENGLPVIEKGIYWQTQGPRLETKAEIRMMTNFADIVGMTMANEAVIAMELNIPYACVCSIDNYGNGLLDEPLGMEEILEGTHKNADLMTQLLKSYGRIYS